MLPSERRKRSNKTSFVLWNPLEDSNLFFLLEECPLYNPFVSVGVFIKPNKVATGGFEWRVVDVAFWSPTGCQLWWSLDSDLM